MALEYQPKVDSQHQLICNLPVTNSLEKRELVIRYIADLGLASVTCDKTSWPFFYKVTPFNTV